MATVWVARLTGKHGFEKLVAVKTILPQYADDAEFRTMFLDEARIAARIRHLNVAEILDLGEEESTLFLVMEWVDGDSLARLYNAIIRANQRFPIDVVARIAADACAGLHAAHELRDDEGTLLGVVHRDVSPQNILVGANGVTKLIDFGVAKAAQRSSQETSAGLMKGKIQYASPEQAIGRALDRRSDIWAMGTVLYQMITGRLPYEAENQLAALHMLTSGKPPRPLPPTVPKAVTEVVRRALAFKVEDRFATADEMRVALERAVSPPAGATQVAAVVARYLSDRADERRRDVADALAAVSGRQKLPSMTSEAGRLHVMTPSSPSQVLPRSAPGLVIPPVTTPSRSGVLAQPRSGTLLGMAAPPAAPPMALTTPAPVSPMVLSPALATPLVALPASSAAEPPAPDLVASSSVSRRTKLGAAHYAVAALGTVMAIAVWGVVAMVGLRAPPTSPATAPPPETKPSDGAPLAAQPPPIASEAPAAVSTAAPAPPPPPAAAASSPPVATTATIEAPPATAPTVAGPLPGPRPPATTPPKKKKKVDDGF